MGRTTTAFHNSRTSFFVHDPVLRPDSFGETLEGAAAGLPRFLGVPPGVTEVALRVLGVPSRTGLCSVSESGVVYLKFGFRCRGHFDMCTY